MNSNIIKFLNDNQYLLIGILLTLHYINCFLESKHKKRNSKGTAKQSNVKLSLKEMFPFIIMLFVLCIVVNIPIIKYIIVPINLCFLFYILIIAPLFNQKIQYSFVKENTMISSFLLMEIIIVSIRLNTIPSQNISNSQTIVIPFLTLYIFLILYMFLMNIRFIFYYLSTNILVSDDNWLCKLINKINAAYDIDYANNKKKMLITEMKQLILFAIFIIIINSLLIAIHYLIKAFKDAFINIDDKYIYAISKLAIISTIFIIYLIIQIDGSYNAKFISSYEFIASTIIIPLILESLLKKSN